MTYVIIIILVAFAFDFVNGFHDSANSIATIVGTRVLSPFRAVLWAATCNFAALFVIGTAVAKTVGKGMIDVDIVTPSVILGGLLGAICWNLITWYFGLPQQLVARAAGRVRGRGGGQGGVGVDHLERVDQDARLHRPLAADRDAAGVRADGGGVLAVQPHL